MNQSIIKNVDKWKTQRTVNVIGDEGAEKISEFLKENTTLTDLDLSCDDVISYKVSDGMI